LAGRPAALTTLYRNRHNWQGLCTMQIAFIEA